MMVATATVATGLVCHVLRRGYPAQFQSLGDVFLDGMLDLVKFFASVQEASRNRIVQQRVAVLLKIGNFRAVQLAALRLFFLERLPFVNHRFVLAPRTGIGHKAVDLAADGGHSGLLDDGLTQRLRLFENQIFFSLSRH